MKKRTYEASNAAKRQICTVLKELMTQKPLNRITVAEIMRGCGMARQHFYYHFDDVYDAVRWIFEEEAVALLREHEGVMLWQDGLLQLFQYLQENRAFCLCALRSMGRDHLKRFFQTDIRTIIQSTIRLIVAELGELIRFVDQVLRDHVRGAGLRLSQAGPGTAPLLEPDHCAGPVSK